MSTNLISLLSRELKKLESTIALLEIPFWYVYVQFEIVTNLWKCFFGRKGRNYQPVFRLANRKAVAFEGQKCH